MRGTLKTLGVIVVGLLVGGAFGIAAGAMLDQSRNDGGAAGRPGQAPMADSSPKSAPPAGTVEVPGAKGSSVRVLFVGTVLGDTVLRRRVGRILSAERAPVILARSNGRVALPKDMDLVILGADKTVSPSALRDLVRRTARTSRDAGLICIGRLALDSACPGGAFIGLGDLHNDETPRDQRLAKAIASRLSF